jgi:hypothetical protein
VVARIAAVLVKYPDVKVDLEGHTDSRGSAEYNLALSKRRAEAVKAGLVAAGVDAARITTSFAGKANLLNAEKDVTDLALNRRVDFKYYDANGASIKAEKQTGDIQVGKGAFGKEEDPLAAGIAGKRERAARRIGRPSCCFRGDYLLVPEFAVGCAATKPSRFFASDARVASEAGVGRPFAYAIASSIVLRAIAGSPLPANASARFW